MELDAFTCRHEAVAGPRREGRRWVFWILGLGSLYPNVAPADGENTHGSQQQESNKSVNFASYHKNHRKRVIDREAFPHGKDMRFESCCKLTGWELSYGKFTHGCNWPNGSICWQIPFGGTMSSRTSEETASPQS